MLLIVALMTEPTTGSPLQRLAARFPKRKSYRNVSPIGWPKAHTHTLTHLHFQSNLHSFLHIHLFNGLSITEAFSLPASQTYIGTCHYYSLFPMGFVRLCLLHIFLWWERIVVTKISLVYFIYSIAFLIMLHDHLTGRGRSNGIGTLLTTWYISIRLSNIYSYSSTQLDG